jgi:hypothetical protein
MSLKFLAPNNGQPTFQTRFTTYTPDAQRVITVPAPTQWDIVDLLGMGCISLGFLGALSNLSATTDPGVANDNTQDYGVGSKWLNTATGVEWQAITVATGAAVWVPLVSAGMLLGRIIGANMNVTTDQPFIMTSWAALNKCRITKVTCKNASVSLTTAAGGIYSAASKGGTALVASGQVYSNLTAATLALDLTIASTPGLTVQAAGYAPILSLTTGQGTAATADFYLFGDIYV